MNSTVEYSVPMVMPQEALVVAIPVLVVSIISLATSSMWFLMQHFHSERWSYVSLMALVVSCSTLASIMQQFWYMTHWRHDRVSEYQQAKIGVEKPTLAIGPLTLGPSLVLFWIQMYCYNVLSALTMCWAVALVRGVYNCRHVGSMRFNEILVPATKICSILLPVILISVTLAPALQRYAVVALVLVCIPMLCCWFVGSVCVVAILIKYVRGLASFTKIEDSRSTDISLSTSTGKSVAGSQTDKWLLLRFTFTFVALCSFEILTINTAFTRQEACLRLSAMDGPDFTTASTVGSILTFIPGVTVGFVGFLVFGTTSFFRKIYAESMRDCCGRRKHNTRARDEEMQDVRTWKAMGSAKGRPTYHCRVESLGGLGEVELTGLSQGGGKRSGVVRTLEAQKSPSKPKQPWKTLGIDCPH